MILHALLLAAVPGLMAQSFSDLASSAMGQIRGQTVEMRKAAAFVNPTQVKVVDPWTEEVRIREYRWSGPTTLNSKISGVLLYETPLPLIPAIAPFTDPFAQEDADKIAARCMRDFAEAWDRIGCVSRGVKAFYKDFNFTGLRSPCRSHAAAFNKAFTALGLPRSQAMIIDADGASGEEHVANVIIVTNNKGNPYAYVIDSLWFPGTLFPRSFFTVKHHDRDGDGRSDFFALPAIGAEPVYKYTP